MRSPRACLHAQDPSARRRTRGAFTEPVEIVADAKQVEQSGGASGRFHAAPTGQLRGTAQPDRASRK